MRSLALLLLLSAVAAAQGMGPPKRVDSWMSKHNQKRLRFSWDLLPPYKPTKLMSVWLPTAMPIALAR